MRWVTMVMICCLSAVASAADSPQALFGVWSLDVSRLSQPHPPRSVTITLVEVADGALRMTVDIVGEDGTRHQVGGAVAVPGSLGSVEGSDEVDQVTFSMPNRRTLVMGGALQGRPSHTRVFALTDDGQQMTETIVGHIDGRIPHIRTNYWKRQ